MCTKAFERFCYFLHVRFTRLLTPSDVISGVQLLTQIQQVTRRRPTGDTSATSDRKSKNLGDEPRLKQNKGTNL